MHIFCVQVGNMTRGRVKYVFRWIKFRISDYRMSIFNFCIDLTVVLLTLRISNQLYMSMVQRFESGSISSRSLVQIYPSDFGVWTIFLKLRILAFICNMWVTQNVLFEKEYLPCLWTFFFLCASYLKLFLPSTSRTMALEVVFLGTFFLRYRQKRVSSKIWALLCWFHQASLVL